MAHVQTLVEDERTFMDEPEGAWVWGLLLLVVSVGLGVSGHARGWGIWPPVLIGLVSGAAAFLVTAVMRHGDEHGVGVVRMLGLTFGGFCSAWISYYGWSAGAFWTLLIGCVVFTAASFATLWVARPKVVQRRVEPPAPVERKLTPAEQWTAHIEAVSTELRGSRVTAVDEWATGTGYTLTVELAPGATRQKLATYTASLASRARLPEGGGVNVRSGGSWDKVLLDVATKNVMAEERPYPAETSPLTINRPLPQGVFRDGSQAYAEMRSSTVLLAAQKRMGKSNLLHVNVADLARCPDALIFAVDTAKDGRFGRPWVSAWVDGEAERPTVDWVATTNEEVELMFEFLVQVIGQRSRAYQRLKDEHDDDKLPVSADVPAIVVLIDEGGELVGLDSRATRAKELILQVIRTGGEDAVNVFLCGLRATSDILPTQAKSQAGTRIGLKVTDESELGYLFGWRVQLTGEDMPYPGCGAISDGTDAPRIFRAYRMTPKQIRRHSIATATLRPDLDEPSLQVPLRRAYETRWERTLPLLMVADATQPAGAVALPGAQSATQPGAQTASMTTQSPEDRERNLRAMQQMAELGERRLIEEGKGLDPAKAQDWLAQFDWGPDGPPTGQMPGPVTVDEDDRARVMRRVLGWMVDLQPVAGAALYAMAQEDFGTACPARATFFRWLAQDPRVAKDDLGYRVARS